MKATCPKDPAHKRFLTTIHEVAEWVVEANGDLVEYKELVEAGVPSTASPWYCYECTVDDALGIRPEAKVDP